MTSAAREIAVVGAGLAGATVADGLARAGHRVTLFEKSRGRGGRMSTRRTPHGSFDHGAQFFTARGPAFRRQVQRWVASGDVVRWYARIAELPAGGDAPKDELFVGAPTMNGPVKRLTGRVRLRSRTRVGGLRQAGGAWELHDDGGASLGRFETVVVTAPAPQTAALLAAAPDLAERVAAVRMAPCRAALVELERPATQEFDAANVRSGPLSWIARNASKPFRRGGETWVLHGSPEWSDATLDDTPEAACDALLGAFGELLDAPLPAVRFQTAHLWRYARTAEPLGDACIWDAERRLGVAGDWCLGARVECAFDSAQALLASIQQS